MGELEALWSSHSLLRAGTWFKGKRNMQQGLDQLRKLPKLLWEEPLPRDVGVALGEVKPCLVLQDPWGRGHFWVGSGDGSLGPRQDRGRCWRYCREKCGGKHWSEKATGGCVSARN